MCEIAPRACDRASPQSKKERKPNMPRPKGEPPASFEIVAVAASAGGISALSKMVPTLPEDFLAPTRKKPRGR